MAHPKKKGNIVSSKQTALPSSSSSVPLQSNADLRWHYSPMQTFGATAVQCGPSPPSALRSETEIKHKQDTNDTNIKRIYWRLLSSGKWRHIFRKINLANFWGILILPSPGYSEDTSSRFRQNIAKFISDYKHHSLKNTFTAVQT